MDNFWGTLAIGLMVSGSVQGIRQIFWPRQIPERVAQYHYFITAGIALIFLTVAWLINEESLSATSTYIILGFIIFIADNAFQN